MSDATPFTLSFGKHKGSTLDRVPLAYLTWLQAQDTLYPATRTAVERELARREAVTGEMKAQPANAPKQAELVTDEERLPKHLEPDGQIVCPHCRKPIALLATAR